MKMMKMTEQSMDAYRVYLTEEEKSRGTIEKYLRDVRRFYECPPASASASCPALPGRRFRAGKL